MVINHAQEPKAILIRLITAVNHYKYAERDFSVETTPACYDSYGVGLMIVKEVNSPNHLVRVFIPMQKQGITKLI